MDFGRKAVLSEWEGSEAGDEEASAPGKCKPVGRCWIILLRPGFGGEAEATAREHAARRDAQLQPFGRAREKGVAPLPVTRSCPVVHNTRAEQPKQKYIGAKGTGASLPQFTVGDGFQVLTPQRDVLDTWPSTVPAA